MLPQTHLIPCLFGMSTLVGAPVYILQVGLQASAEYACMQRAAILHKNEYMLYHTASRPVTAAACVLACPVMRNFRSSELRLPCTQLCINQQPRLTVGRLQDH